MSKFSEKKSYSKSIQYANKGLRVALKSQKNFRFQLAISVFVVIVAILLNFNMIEMCLIVFAIGLVLVCELFNSVIEFALDALYHNKRNTLVGLAKDMSAGAVLVSTCTAGIIGTILFSNRIFDLIVPGFFWY